MINYPKIDGLKYFINLCTLDRNFIYLPREIRETIWNVSDKTAYIICNLNNNNIQIQLHIKL